MEWALQVDLDPLDTVHSRLDHGLDVQGLLGGLHLAGHGAQAGVAGRNTVQQSS